MHERQNNMIKKRILGAAIAVAAVCGSMTAQSAD